MQVCIADLKRKDQKDGAHDNLIIMTSGSKFGMPAFQVADQVISKFCVPCSWHSHTDVYSISSDSAHWLIKGLHQPSGKQFKIASYVQAKEYLIEYTGADPGGWIGWLATPFSSSFT